MTSPINVMDAPYGATGNGVTDDTSSIQEAINASNGTVYFPPGNYLVSSTLNISNVNGIRLVGESLCNSQIVPSGSFDVFHFKNANCCIFERISISHSPSPSSGSCLNIESCGDFIARDFYFFQPYVGITVQGLGGPTFIENFNISNAISVGIIWNQPVNNTGNNGGNIFIGPGVMSWSGSNLATGYLSISGDTQRVANVDILEAYIGVNMSPQSGQTVQWSFFENVACDTCINNGWVFNTTNGGNIKSVSLVNCWGASCGSVGFQIQGGDGIHLSSCRAFNNAGSGISLGISATNVTIEDCKASGNGAAGAAPGIAVSAGISNFAIRDCFVGPMSGFGNTQNFGIYIASGTSANYIVTNNWLHGNLTQGLSDGGAGPKLIGSNLT